MRKTGVTDLPKFTINCDSNTCGLIVVVDSSQPEFPLLYETTFGALAHVGIPFRVADLARGGRIGAPRHSIEQMELAIGCVRRRRAPEEAGARQLSLWGGAETA